MGFKKAALYRGFNIFVEEVRAGVWGVSVVEVPSTEDTGPSRGPSRSRVPGGHPDKETALLAARLHIDRIHRNRQNRANQRPN